MINSLYQSLNKGSFRTLSFILALILTIFFFFNVNQFATQLRAVEFYYVLGLIWGMVILWIHGIGFEIRLNLWRAIFMPWIGYIAGIDAFLHNLIS
ncbi:cyd operon protein YbgE [Aggregatibacter actinomycetemcomitans]|uniref:cyd operon protein YbgE n=1 Tax=Aggregatibacter actinomycetemcomitans TaxID=714 RepID=UPI00023FF787|nr:cyd operon protein YbgE [Aggregatibacter actinomycetemcomitans]EHK89500.1 cyd operon protein YbgE [Aggregatibacter actinomycetemcomitans RhAA1]KNE76604.1 cytochrome bd biosynthesis protein [Aggregatibacter actinomycetemcomitans RhAA1]